jgi:hypothetical protein
MLIMFVVKEHVRFLILMSFLLCLNVFVKCITQNEKDLICIEIDFFFFFFGSHQS